MDEDIINDYIESDDIIPVGHCLNNPITNIIKSNEISTDLIIKDINNQEYNQGNSTDLITQDFSNNEYSIDKLNYQNFIDQKIIEICENMYNDTNKFKDHRYNYMSDFLKYSIHLTENILELIDTLSNLINENSNYFMDDGILNCIKAFIDEFKSNCMTIHYFNKESNIDELNDLLFILGEYLNSNYYLEEDFKNNEFLYSNIQLTWSMIKINLTSYRDLQFKKYQKLNYPQKKHIIWETVKLITGFFYPSTQEQSLVIKNEVEKEEEEKPIITNKIKWKGKIYDPNGNNQKLISVN